MTRRVAPPPRARSRGLVLIVVLWGVVLLTLLATSFSFSLRTEARLTTALIERARAGAAAEAGVHRLMATLAGTDRRRFEALDARMHFDGMDVVLRMEPENARIDLNAAPAALLEGLVRRAAAGLAEDIDAGAVVDAILDWRDTDSVPRPRGAEASDYESAGLAMHPRNSALLSVSELSQVRGVSPELYQALAPLVTVYAWSPRVDALSASREVLLAVPGLAEASVQAFLAQRREDANPRRAMTLLAGAERYVASAGSGVFSLAARASGADGVNVSRRAVVKLTGSSTRPVSVLAWFEDAAAALPAPGDQAPPPGSDEAN
jgi:general secretion pathway protein K